MNTVGKSISGTFLVKVINYLSEPDSTSPTIEIGLYRGMKMNLSTPANVENATIKFMIKTSKINSNKPTYCIFLLQMLPTKCRLSNIEVYVTVCFDFIHNICIMYSISITINLVLEGISISWPLYRISENITMLILQVSHIAYFMFCKFSLVYLFYIFITFILIT